MGAARDVVSGFPTSAFLAALPWTGGAVLVVIAATFVAAQVAHRNDVVDTAWGLLFVAAALTALVRSSGHGDDVRRWLLAGMVTVWGLRLAGHVGRRSVGRPEDPRYVELLRRGHADPRVNAVLKVFLPQAVLAFLISAPVQVGPFERGPVGVLGVVGVAVWAVGLFFEAVGDAQLERYKAWKRRQPREDVAASVMDRGLWRLTRHPNYVGDAAVWTGLFLVAAERWPGVLTAPSLAVVVFLLTLGSGKRNLECSMMTRPGYPEYAQRTSGFLPWKPRRGPAGPPSAHPQPADISLLRRRTGPRRP